MSLRNELHYGAEGILEEISGFRRNLDVVRNIKLTYHPFLEEYQVFETLA
jgi:hypothetical protein